MLSKVNHLVNLFFERQRHASGQDGKKIQRGDGTAPINGEAYSSSKERTSSKAELVAEKKKVVIQQTTIVHQQTGWRKMVLSAQKVANLR